ncbi:hypothetical protein ACEN9J_37555 [Variovorax sp. Varisp41]|jgi:uridylate kinase|uniref:hypothetical protein n=1 Tax=Variovorax sp. Varisp41 TaxID=3243033 RepID=UPI0039B546A3
MTDRRTVPGLREDAGHATAEDGVVILDGPNGVAVTMTADAAALTAERLHAASLLAREQLAASKPESEGPSSA